MKRLRTLFHGALALVLSVNLTFATAWHDHAGHSPASHGGALELASHQHPQNPENGHSHAGHSHAGHSHAGHSHAGHSHAGHSHAGHSHGADRGRLLCAVVSPLERMAEPPGWSSSGSGDEHPDGCAVCRFLGQSSAPTIAARLEVSQPIDAAVPLRTTTTPVARIQRRQQTRAPPAVS